MSFVAGRSRTIWIGAALCGLLLAVAMMSTKAHAAAPASYVFDPNLSLEGNCQGEDGSIDPSCPYQPPPAGPKELDAPCGVTTDTHGSIYVANPVVSSAEGRIDIFNAKGEFLVEIPDSMRPCQIAVDSVGNLYVFEQKVDTKEDYERVYIARYSPNTYPPVPGVQYAQSARMAFVVREPGKAEKSCVRPQSIATDPSNDHLYVSNDCYVEEYGSAAEGTPVNPLIECCIGEAALKGNTNHGRTVLDVYGKNHDVYISAGSEDNKVSTYRIFVFDGATGEVKCILKGTGVGEESEAMFDFGLGGPIAIDQADGDLFAYDVRHEVIDQFALDAKGDLSCPLYSYSQQLPAPTTEPHPHITQLFVEIDVDSPCRTGIELSESCDLDGYNSPNTGEVYFTAGVNQSNSHVYALKERHVHPPEIRAQAPSEIGESEASLKAEVNPGGLETHYHFEYVTQSNFDQHGYANAISAPKPDASVGNGGAFVGVVSSVTGLESDTSYRFRLVATNCNDPEADPKACLTTGEGMVGGEGTDVDFTTYPGRSFSSRAYELVTPPDTGGHTPTMSMVGGEYNFSGFDTTMVSPNGKSLMFGSRSGAVPGLGGGGYQDVYESRRDEVSGWQSRFTGLTGKQAEKPRLGGLSPDHAYAFWYVPSNDRGTLIRGGEGARYLSVPNTTVHSPNCAVPNEPEGRLEWIACGAIGFDSTDKEDELRGRLITSSASHVVFETPNPVESCAPPAGTNVIYDRAPGGPTRCISFLPGDIPQAAGQSAVYRGASADGTAVAFSIGTNLYLRLNDLETIEVAEGNPTFGGIAANGSTVFYLSGGNIFAFDAVSGEAEAVGGGGESTLVYVSRDGSHAFFSSPKKLDGENGEADKNNLYVWSGASPQFIGVLDSHDFGGQQGLGRWLGGALNPSPGPGAGPADVPARSTADGSVFIFESQADLGGFDANERRQVYRFEAGAPAAKHLLCLSCNPTGIPTGSAGQLESLPATDPLSTFPPVNSLTQIANVTEDGGRVFFQSSERLVSDDLDKKQDVYEWQMEGARECHRERGCLVLISSPKSAEDEYLYAMTPNGHDVFFLSGNTLVPQDPDGVPSIYDAREGGGFAPSDPPPSECLGEACQPTVTPPAEVTPTSSGFEGSGSKPRCPKARRLVHHAGQVHCAKRPHKHNKHKHRKHPRRAGR